MKYETRYIASLGRDIEFKLGKNAADNFDIIESSKTNDDIAMIVIWQPVENAEQEDDVPASETPICISGIGISQLFAASQTDSHTNLEWAPIVQTPHPFFRPLGKPDNTIGYLSVQTPLQVIGYTTLYSNRISYSKISKILLNKNWQWKEEQKMVNERLRQMHL